MNHMLTGLVIAIVFCVPLTVGASVMKVGYRRKSLRLKMAGFITALLLFRRHLSCVVDDGCGPASLRCVWSVGDFCDSCRRRSRNRRGIAHFGSHRAQPTKPKDFLITGRCTERRLSVRSRKCSLPC